MKIGAINCGTNAKNTGWGKCAFDLGYARKFFKLTDEDQVFTQADYDDWENVLRDLILAGKAQRMYPYPNWEAITDNSGERSFNTLGYGRLTPGAKTFNDWTFDYLDGAHCAYEALASHDGPGSFLVIDSNGRTWAQKVDGGFKGIPMDQITLDLKLADGTANTKYAVRFIVDPMVLRDSLLVLEKIDGFNPLTLQGLQDVDIEVAAGGTTTAPKVTVTTGCGNTDMGVLFPAAMLVLGNWKGVLISNGTTVSATSVTYNATTGVFTVTFSGPVASVSLAPAATLAAAGIDGFESNVLKPVVAGS